MSESTRRKWLRHWHDIIDAEFGPDPMFNFEVAFNDPCGDFRMQFMTWDLSDDALRRCFEILPRGAELVDRAIEMQVLYRRTSRPELTDQEALDLFQQGLDAYAHFSDAPELKQPIQVKHVTADKFIGAISYMDRIAVVFEDVDFDMPDEASEVCPFLSETLYRLANSYEVSDYIEWAFVSDPDSIEPHRPFLPLAFSPKYYPMMAGDGPVLIVEVDQAN